MSRGAFIVFEGGDRCGKSTQSSKLAEALKEEGIPVEHLHFPDRNSSTGKVIDDYLKEKDLDDHAIHLLFVANRWEAAQMMREKLKSGVTLVVDRYSYSGVAYSAAKDKPGLDLKWCMQSERGLPKPDLVVFMNLSPSVAAERSSFGSERYENVKFQDKVVANFNKLRSSNWMEFDASKSTEELHKEIKIATDELLRGIKPQIDLLWTEDDVHSIPLESKVVCEAVDSTIVSPCCDAVIHI